ncbi:MAG: four helix bundle protein [bacterium]|nr:four helix bundle protein [bacterium]
MKEGFKSLIVWQKSMELADVVFHLTKRFPREELYGLTSQMRRSAISIPSNIAEGSRRTSRKDYSQFLRIACGSAVELETQLLLASKWYPNISTSVAFSLVIEVEKMLSMMLRKLGD